MWNSFGSEKEIDQSFSNEISVRSNFPHMIGIWIKSWSWANYRPNDRTNDTIDGSPTSKIEMKISRGIVWRVQESGWNDNDSSGDSTVAIGVLDIRVAAVDLLSAFFLFFVWIFFLHCVEFFVWKLRVYLWRERARAPLNARFVMNDWMSNADYVCILLQVVLVHLVRSPCYFCVIFYFVVLTDWARWVLVRVSARLRLVLNTINATIRALSQSPSNACVFRLWFSSAFISLFIPLMTRIFRWKLFSFVLWCIGQWARPLQFPEMACNCYNFPFVSDVVIVIARQNE